MRRERRRTRISAAPMIGGMISSTVLTLVVIPVLYALVKMREVK
jgi:Cu(I)/Ag(I) efflux system membrane protein CusA/SilA